MVYAKTLTVQSTFGTTGIHTKRKHKPTKLKAAKPI